ncbi:hypothetical protein TSTA_125420 [Talaromyces stipitatus ATCC 10500]|uniref:Uncharacterized protein n=1 Tax=Talaromyces stipitatus (strain ATCC 10500 / CBS 375.48 / QM 6759 / NRRL 1006) TaxID=441959 RepID=B8MCL2_TALSN|nr:uncharacterized protein TSTA_125420 [Talaromyces stipitatus ATCC 10500]EED18828.1 hypothetical protein TSTA_125420 [Talaromyces stipitatus ATCC 10500]
MVVWGMNLSEPSNITTKPCSQTMAQGLSTKEPRRVYLFTHPRVTSNLLVKILNVKEQNVPPSDKGGYFFQTPVYKAIELKIRHKATTAWTDDEVSAIRELYEKSISDLQKWIDEAEKNGQFVFIKEHAIFMIDPVSVTNYHPHKRADKERADGTEALSELRKQWQFGRSCGEVELPNPSPLNQTVVSDEFLLSFTPTFLIRHPALTFPSFLRAYIGEGMPKTNFEASALVDELDHSMTFHWMHHLYDFYVSKGIEPLVVESDDVISSHEVVIDYAHHIGLDTEKLHWNWSPASEKQLEMGGNSRLQRFLGTIMSSSGVMNDKMAKNLDLAVERKKWKQEFGGLIGEKMVEWVEAAMEDYEYLKERRLRPSST